MPSRRASAWAVYAALIWSAPAPAAGQEVAAGRAGDLAIVGDPDVREVMPGIAVLGARASGPGRLWVEVDSDPRFPQPQAREADTRARGGYEASVTVEGLRPGTLYHYRFWFSGRGAGGGEASRRSPVRHGSFRTAPLAVAAAELALPPAAPAPLAPAPAAPAPVAPPLQVTASPVLLPEAPSAPPAAPATAARGAPPADSEPAPPPAAPLPAGRDSVNTARRSGQVIRDPRLEADATLFPYEWPALSRLLDVLARLRPAIESAAVAELATALPAVRAAAEALVADSVPPALVASRQELRGRMIALRSALDQVEELAPAAREAPSRQPAGAILEIGGQPPPAAPADGAPIEGPGRGGGAAAAQAEAELEVEEGAWKDLQDPAWTGDAAPEESPAEPLPTEADPLEAYLQAWRDAVLQTEAILHRVRDPRGSGSA